MNTRSRVAALFAAAGLAAGAASVVVAAPPTYFVDVTKSASPASVPPGGGSVDFTVSVEATGTGFFQTVVVSDDMVGCVLAGPFGDEPSGPGAGNLDSGEIWTYTCTVAGVLPGTTNTATANACHSTSVCAAVHDATDSGSVTLGQGPAVTSPPVTEPPVTEPPVTEPPVTEPPVTEPPVTEPPVTEDPGSFQPTDEVAAGTDAPSQAATDTELSGGAIGSTTESRIWLLVAALCFLIGSIIIRTPTSGTRRG